MKSPFRSVLGFIMLMISTSISLLGSEKTIKLVSPNASPEATALLEMLYSISGKYILTGQHNYPNTQDRNSKFAEKYIGQTPVIWSTDMGFAKDGDTDSHLARPDIVKEAIRQFKLGSIVTLCWHAVPPTADEPVTFRPLPGANPAKLESVQGQLTDEQFKDVLTPGTQLNKKWMAQVDTVAYFLKQLRDAHVPVLWRPYHEMNGNWFWWGARSEGEYTTKALYRALFDRLVNHHKLNNLIWVWSVDRINNPSMDFEKYYPGNEYLDILALDVYGSDFNQKYYDGLKKLSNGKIITLGEVGNPPTQEIMESQPDWCYWVVWAGMVRNTTKEQWQKHIASPRVLFQEKEAYINTINTLREKCNLPKLSNQPNTLQGVWLLNDDKSLAKGGMDNLPYKLKIVQFENELMVERYFIVEWAEDNISHDSYIPNGEEIKSEMRGSPIVSTVKWSEKGDLLIDSKVTFSRGGEKSEMISKETWTLDKGGKVLKIKQNSTSPWGDRNSELVYERQ